ncbi:MAG TPA: SIMPL domain-containing protein, partial [Rhodothermales bacterium]|nr:SIMPL domain-containing protein [Rhodothermales bacterium]
LDGVAYELDNRDAARNEALVNALTDAREKAMLMTSTLGVTLGPVQTINEQSFNFPRPMLQMARNEMAMSKDAMPEPEAYAAGEIEVTATVQVVFTLQ